MGKTRINRDENFSVIGNTILQDRNLSLKAKGMASLIFSLGDGWEVSIERLTAFSKDGRDAVRNAVIELEDAGYLVRERVRGNDGLLSDMDYVISDSPASQKPACENPTQDTPTDNKITHIKETSLKETQYLSPSLHSGDDISSVSGKPVSYDEIVSKYNETCKSLPKARPLSPKRKKMAKACWLQFGEEMFEGFKKAEASDYLSGRNGVWTACDIEWLLNQNNMLKVLEGRYDNKGSTHSTKLSDAEVSKLKAQGKLPSDYTGHALDGYEVETWEI